jgi:hypothetical protein
LGGKTQNTMSFPQSTPGMTRLCALLFAVASFIICVCGTAEIIHGLWSGVINYSPGRAEVPQLVSRAASPEKFQNAIAGYAYLAALSGGMALISFIFYRKLGE